MEPKKLLGATVWDTLTGFTGTVVAQVEYLNGLVQCHVQPQGDPDGPMPKSQWIDHYRLVLTEGGMYTAPVANELPDNIEER